MKSITEKAKTLLFPICFCAYTSIYIARVNLSVAAPELQSSMILTTGQFGLMGAAFSITYAVGRMLSGVIGDRLAPWKLICPGLFLVGLANLTIGFFPPFIFLFLLWSINALAQSMLWSPLLRIVSYNYSPEKAKKKASVLGFSIAVGNVLGILLSGYVISLFGAAWSFFVPCIISLILCLLIYLSSRDIVPPKTEAQQSISIGSLFMPLAKKANRRMLLPAMLHGIVKDNISLWMSVYIADRFALHLESTVWYIMLIPLAGLIGRFCYPVIFALTKDNEYYASGIGAVIGVAAAAVLIVSPESPLVCVLCLAALYASVSIINTTILAIFPMQFSADDSVSSVSGFMDFATYLGAGIGSLIFARLISLSGYGAMFAVWGAALLVCSVCFFSYRRYGLLT